MVATARATMGTTALLEELEQRRDMAKRRVKRLLPLWAEYARDGYSAPGVDYERSPVIGSAPQSRPPIPEWLLELDHAIARLAPRWQHLLWYRYVQQEEGIETAQREDVHPATIYRWSNSVYADLVDLLGWVQDS